MARLKHLRHERFCREYVRRNYNGAAAARAVGAPQASCRSTACEYLAKPNIIARISELNEDFLNDIALNAADVAATLAHMASFNPADLSDDDGNPIPIHQLPREVALGVQETTLTETSDGKTVYIAKKSGKDTKGALDSIAKHLNWFEEHQNSGKSEMNIVISEKDERL